MHIPRRTFLDWLGALSASTALAPASRLLADILPDAPAGHRLPSFDQTMEDFMRARKIPGGALAVVKDRRLVYARGYGEADRERHEPARPESLFRIASVSKPITALAVFKLIESRRLELDARLVDVLSLNAAQVQHGHYDARWEKITLRHLLQHTSGWNRDKSFDPMFRSSLIARVMGGSPPAGADTIIRYMLGQPLDFGPGTQYAYSNFGYCLLGRVIERAGGDTYERYVRRHILEPCGIKTMRLGASLKDGRTASEVSYYTSTDRQVRSVFPPKDNAPESKVAEPYGGFYLEAMDAHGGWLASAVDLARLSAALADPAKCPILKEDSLRRMYARPAPPLWQNADGTPTDYYYGCGWMVRPVAKEGRANYWHAGSLPGTYSLWVRRWDGLSWVALFNQRSEDSKMPDSDIDPALHRAAGEVLEW